MGGDGGDYLSGDKGDDSVAGDAGDDSLNGGLGNDVIEGGSGVDLMWFGRSKVGVTVDLAEGQASGMGRDRMSGIEDLGGTYRGDDTLIGDESANMLQGFGGDDVIRGEGGDDRLLADQGDDLYDGGLGRNVIDYRYSYYGPVIVNLLAGSATGDGEDIFVSINDVTGTQYSDLLIGDDAANILNGLGGDDILRGGVGDDTHLGGRGWDVMFGGPGDDVLEGNQGFDGADYGRAGGPVSVDLSMGSATGTGPHHLKRRRRLRLGLRRHARGDDASNIVNGRAGNDSIDAGGGDDLIQGGPGDDNYLGGEGVDTLDFGTSPDPMNANLGKRIGDRAGNGHDRRCREPVRHRLRRPPHRGRGHQPHPG